MCKFGIIPEDKFGGEAYIFYLFCTLLAPHSSLGVVLPVMVMYYETGCSFLIRNGWVLSIASPSLEKCIQIRIMDLIPDNMASRIKGKIRIHTFLALKPGLRSRP